MNITSIKTKKDYTIALQRLEIIFDAKRGTPEGDELEALSILIEHYENINDSTDVLIQEY
ncbi:MAG: hypothetical protein J7497_10965 [Chitinophagaceae bacterium]|nr:hypothetical protein [Chitinophagaceae bacterium]